MSNIIVQRLEKLLSAPCAEKQSKESTYSDKLHASIIANHGGMSTRDIIDARIALTEEGEDVTDQQVQSNMNDKNQTFMNLGVLAASIYFWSPYLTWMRESTQRKDSFVNFSQAALVMMANNPQTPSSTLKWLSAHGSVEVRKSVAANENTDCETLRLLAEDSQSSVKIAILKNVKVSKDIAAKLANDEDFNVSTTASQIYYQLDIKFQAPTPLSRHADKTNILQNEREFRKVVAKSVDDDQRKLFVNSPRISADWHIRMLVAGDPNGTAEMLWQLATHPISQVKRKFVDKYNFLLETMVNLNGNNKVSAIRSLAASEIQTIN